MHATTKLCRLSFALICWVLTADVPVLAQGVTGGLFGATRADAGDRDKLDTLVSVAEGIDSDVPLEFVSFLPHKDVRSGGRSTVMTATADYSRTRRRLQLFGSASTYFRYARRLDRLDAGSQSGQLGVSIRLPKQGIAELTQSAAYSPSYLYLLLPTAAPLAAGEAVPVHPEFQIDQTEAYSYHSRMTLAFGSLRGTRLSATADYGRNDFKGYVATQRRLETVAARAKLSRAMSRRAAISAEYEYSTGKFGLLTSTNAHRGTFGVEYTPALSVTRRATFRLAVSSTRFDIPESVRLYPLQGEASIDYPFRLKWRAVASYRRAVDYVPGLTEPMFTHGGRMRLAGVIGTRVDVSAIAASATAASVISRGIRDFRSYTGEARLRYAFTRNVALFSEYSYYYHDLRGRAHLAAGLPDIYKQHGVRVGVMLFAQPIGN